MTKYGNNLNWCFLEDDWISSQTIEIWGTIGPQQEEVIAYAVDKYSAKRIVDALITTDNVNAPSNKLTKKETVLLQFIAANCAEPWTTMANNAIMWNDREAYNKLKAKFGEIY